MTPKRSVWRTVAGVCLLIATIVGCAALAANLANGAEDDARQQTQQQREQQQRERLLAQMRELAKQTQVRFQQGDRQPQLVASPVFRYDDKPRHFLDATLWVWTDEGRPVAFEKIEAMDTQPAAWQYCFTSGSAQLLTADWQGGRRYRTTEPGIELRPLPDEPAVGAGAAQRKRHARELIRDFSARILTDLADNRTEAMRLLPRPIYEYSEPESKAFRGAVFGMTTNGTNPDLLILLEIGGEEQTLHWNYAVARMTTGGLKVHYRETPVWEADYVSPPTNVFPKWTYFSIPRRDVVHEDPPRLGGAGGIVPPKKAD